MSNLILSAIGVSVTAFATYLFVQIVNGGRKPLTCASWGTGVLLFGYGVIAPSFSPTYGGTNGPAFLPFLDCIAGFVHSFWLANRQRR